MLAKVSALPITEWNYITDGETLPHLGPKVQDFYAAFNVGLDDQHISMVDADGHGAGGDPGVESEAGNRKPEVRGQNSEFRNSRPRTRS